MKPENRAESEQSGDRQGQHELTNRPQELTTEGSKTEGSSNKVLELSEDEQAVLSILKNNSPMDLNELKGQAGLSINPPVGAFLSPGCHF